MGEGRETRSRDQLKGHSVQLRDEKRSYTNQWKMRWRGMGKSEKIFLETHWQDVMAWMYGGGRSGKRNNVGPGMTLKFPAAQPIKPSTEGRKVGVEIGLWEEENEFNFWIC